VKTVCSLGHPYSDNNEQPMDCDTQLAATTSCLFTPTFFSGRFWPVN